MPGPLLERRLKMLNRRLAQMRADLAVANEHRLSALFSVALACGLRLGEATGLKWEDVDLSTGEVRIRQQLQVVKRQLVLQDLKTVKSRRTLALPPVCVNALRAYRTRQREQRLKAGPDWVESGLVFTTARRGAGRMGPLASGAGRKSMGAHRICLRKVLREATLFLSFGSNIPGRPRDFGALSC